MVESERDKDKHIQRLVEAIDRTYHHTGLLVWRGFLIGLASGLGATLGVAIVVAGAGILLRQLGGLPWIGQYLLNAVEFLPTNQTP
ncbi:MAG: DUF5665 domain-containing protein [Patescibacteria group bacterium]